VAITFPKETPGEFLNQRIRWGSKTTLYRDPLPIALAAFVLLLNLLLVSSPFLIAFGLMNPWVAGLCFIFKIAVDAWFLLAVGRFFRRKNTRDVIISGLFHPMYIAITALAGMFVRPRWKGR
jgi:poly-beta-1,6-N-acetyl-D-glucosamine synthase